MSGQLPGWDELPASGSDDEEFSASSSEWMRQPGHSYAQANAGQGAGSGPANINFFDALAYPETGADGNASDSHNSAGVANEVADSPMAYDDSAYDYDEYDSSGGDRQDGRHVEEHDEVDHSDEYEHVDKLPRGDEGYESGGADNDDGEVGPDGRGPSLLGSEDSVFTGSTAAEDNDDGEVGPDGRGPSPLGSEAWSEDSVFTGSTAAEDSDQGDDAPSLDDVEPVDDQLDLAEGLDDDPEAEEPPAGDVSETGPGRVDISSMSYQEIRLALIDHDTPIAGHVHEHDIAPLRNIHIKRFDYFPAGRAPAGDVPAMVYCQALPRQPEGLTPEQVAARRRRLPPPLESPGPGSTIFLRECALLGAGRAALQSTGRVLKFYDT